MDFRFYLSIFLRRLPYFLIFVAFGTALGIALAAVAPPVYRAEARLVVESEQIPGELAASTVQTDASEQLQIIQQRILTRDNLLELANRLDIYDGPNAPEQPLSPDQIVSDLRQRIGIQIRGFARRGQTQARIVTVDFRAPTAPLAANVANEVVSMILAENVEMRTSVAGQTLDFFNREVERLDQELSQLSGEILAFKEANQEALPDSLEFRRSQQAAAQERLIEQERAENALRDRRERLVALYESTGEIDGLGTAGPRTAEARRLQQLKDQLSTSVAVLSLDNPRVAVLRAQIEALEAVVAEQAAAGGTATGTDGTPLSPYEIQLADIDSQLETIAAQKEQIETQLEELAVTIAATPGNALTLGELQRDYENLQTQYNRAVSNRARAETGDIIESLSKGQRITVLEQAIAPRRPTSPDRQRIAATGAAGGVAMGLAFIALMELLNTAIRRPADLVGALDITPFATLPYIRTRRQIWRRRLLIAAAFLAVLVGLPALLWLVHTQVTPLEPLLRGLLRQLDIG